MGLYNNDDHAWPELADRAERVKPAKRTDGTLEIDLKSPTIPTHVIDMLAELREMVLKPENIGASSIDEARMAVSGQAQAIAVELLEDGVLANDHPNREFLYAANLGRTKLGTKLARLLVKTAQKQRAIPRRRPAEDENRPVVPRKRTRARKAFDGGRKLARRNLSGSSFVGEDFSRANLSRAKCIGTSFDGAVFAAADLTGGNFSGASFRGAEFCAAMVEVREPVRRRPRRMPNESKIEFAIRTSAGRSATKIVEDKTPDGHDHDNIFAGLGLQEPEEVAVSSPSASKKFKKFGLPAATPKLSSLIGANCANADFSGATFAGVAIVNANFQGACLCGAKFLEVQVGRAAQQRSDAAAEKYNELKEAEAQWRANSPPSDVNVESSENIFIGLGPPEFPEFPHAAEMRKLASLILADIDQAPLLGETRLDLADFSGATYDDTTVWPAGFDPEGRGLIRVDRKP